MPVHPLEHFINRNRADFDQDLPEGLWSKIAADLEQTTKYLDRVEAFVTSHRADFDTEEPPAGLWNNLLADLPATAKVVSLQTRRNPTVWYRVAAAAAVILVAGALLLGRQMGLQEAQDQQLALIYAIDPEFPEAEAYYQNEIGQLFHQVSSRNSDPQLYADLEAIDQSMQELRDQLAEVPRDQQAALVADLIKSYQIKLQILEKVMQLLPEPSADETTKQSKTSI